MLKAAAPLLFPCAAVALYGDTKCAVRKRAAEAAAAGEGAAALLALEWEAFLARTLRRSARRPRRAAWSARPTRPPRESRRRPRTPAYSAASGITRAACRRDRAPERRLSGGAGKTGVAGGHGEPVDVARRERELRSRPEDVRSEGGDDWRRLHGCGRHGRAAARARCTCASAADDCKLTFFTRRPRRPPPRYRRPPPPPRHPPPPRPRQARSRA